MKIIFKIDEFQGDMLGNAWTLFKSTWIEKEEKSSDANLTLIILHIVVQVFLFIGKWMHMAHDDNGDLDSG